MPSTPYRKLVTFSHKSFLSKCFCWTSLEINKTDWKLKAIEIARLDIPQKDFTEIKFETKVGRMMAFTMTKIRNHVIQKINDRAEKLHQFKLKGLDAMLSIDILQDRTCLWLIQILDLILRLNRPSASPMNQYSLYCIDTILRRLIDGNWKRRSLKKSFMKEEHWLECSYRNLFTSVLTINWKAH